MNRLFARIDYVIVHHNTSHTPLKIWIPLHVMSVKIADDGNLCGVVVNQAAFGVLLPGVRRVTQSLSDDAVAERDPVRGVPSPLLDGPAVKTRAGSREILVGCPGTGTMINYDVVRAGRDTIHLPPALFPGSGFSGPDTDMTDYYIVSFDANPASDERNTGAGRCLTGNC